MSLRPAISTPLPWLTFLTGKLFGEKRKERGKKRLFKFPRSLRVTTEGKWFIGILLFIGIAAINTGNNLLYLVVATLLSIIMISGFLSESTLRGVNTIREFPRHIYKREPALVRIKVTNRKRIFPSFSFFASETPVEGLEAERLYTLKIDPSTTENRTARYTFSRRGRYSLQGMRVHTRFPFGIFTKGKAEEAPCELIVYPAIREPRRGFFVEEGNSTRGAASSRRKGSGGQLYGLREYTLADEARFIHWRSAAKNTRLLLKEHEKEAENRLMIIFDNYSAPTSEAFEDLVDEASSLASHLIKRGFPVGLKTLDGEIPPSRGTRKLHLILQTLALIGPSSSTGVPGVKVVSI